MAEAGGRSRRARAVAESMLVAVAHHYGARPGFVLLGGLVPDLLCGAAPARHVGTSDVDVQVDLELAAASTDAVRLEGALRGAGLAPSAGTAWRWLGRDTDGGATVRFELLADLDHAPAGATVRLAPVGELGAVNVRGTALALVDTEVRRFSADVDGSRRTVEIAVAGLAGFLMAKCAAARSRREPKDWYDLTFVLLHNDAGGVDAAAHAVRERFADRLSVLGPMLDDLRANFADPAAQGPRAYVAQMRVEHPEEDPAMLAADAVLAVEAFHRQVTGRSRRS